MFCILLLREMRTFYITERRHDALCRMARLKRQATPKVCEGAEQQELLLLPGESASRHSTGKEVWATEEVSHTPLGGASHSTPTGPRETRMYVLNSFIQSRHNQNPPTCPPVGKQVLRSHTMTILLPIKKQCWCAAAHTGLWRHA